MSRSLRTTLALAAVLALAGCGAAATGGTTPPPAAVQRAAAATDTCADGQPRTASISPDGISTSSSPSSPTLDAIRSRKRLVVGTAGDVVLWGARNPQNGRLEGFDIDLLKAVADQLKVGIEFKVINYAQRLPALQSGSVDLVAHTMTINCDRWQGTGSATNAIDLSAEYYEAGQKVLVRSDIGDIIGKKIAPVDVTIDDLKGQPVCVAAGSTNLENIADKPVKKVVVDDLGDCLVKFQEGEAVAITGDDAVLAGFAAQDRYAVVANDKFSSEPYGLGVRAGDETFVRYLNALLEKWRGDGTLSRFYDSSGLRSAFNGDDPDFGRPVYGRKIDALGRS